jgi:diguanylate cyclase (GGDEF)-like protein
MADKKQVTDISGLSQAIVEALKEITTCGKSLTLPNLNRALSHRSEIATLFEQANVRPEKRVTPGELEALKTQIETVENRRKETLRQMAELESRTGLEWDFFRRLTATLVGLARIPENASYYLDLDDLRTRVQEDRSLDALETSLKSIKSQMLREGVGGMKHPEKAQNGASQSGSSMVKSFFGRGEKGASDDTIARLKKEGTIALQEIQTILGEDFRASVHLAQQYIDRSRDLDSLIAQKTYVLSLIGGYVQRAQKEKDQVTAFLREVSERLVTMEKEVVAASSASRDVQLNDKSFNDNLENEIQSFQESASKNGTFETLRAFVESQLTSIANVLHDRRIEYTTRIEKAQKESETLKKNFRGLIGKVIEKNKALTEEIQRDPLTEIFNRRTYDSTLSSEFDRFQRYQKPFSLILFDVDRFKGVNDRYGHEAGDKVLKAIARKVRETLRKPDVFARYGGEEFAVILPETGIENGIFVATKIRELIDETVFEYDDERVPVTVSLGVTEVLPTDTDPASVAKRADMYLYRAKAEGRNKMVSDRDV